MNTETNQSVAPFGQAVVALRSRVPKEAMTAELLGRERHGHAVRVTPDGLLLTTGYTVMEADEIWLTNREGQSSSAVILAQDYDSGLALLKPLLPLGNTWLKSAAVSSARAGDNATVLTSKSTPMHVNIFAVEEFTGRWEYLLEQGIYTIPACEHWSGAALINDLGELLGIGSLALGINQGDGHLVPGNLFIPVDLVMPHIDHLVSHGEMPGARRPWLGLLTEEEDNELHVMGIYHDAPAANAGIRPGDVIVSVGTTPITSMPDFFRTLWHFGPAGSKIPVTIKAEGEVREVILHSTDRNAFFSQHEAQLLN